MMSMRIVIKATNLRLTFILRAYIERKAAKLARFTKLLAADAICRIEIGKTTAHHRSGRVFRAEINCDVPGLRSKLLRAESEHWDPRSAVDQAIDEMVRQLVELRKKFSARYKRGARELKQRIREGSDGV